MKKFFFYEKVDIIAKKYTLSKKNFFYKKVYYKSSSEEKKKMILDALMDQSSKDQSDVPFIEYVLRAFGNSIKVSRDLVIKYVHENADFENEISVYSTNGKILAAISLLLVYQILQKDDEKSDILVKTI